MAEHKSLLHRAGSFVSHGGAILFHRNHTEAERRGEEGSDGSGSNAMQPDAALKRQQSNQCPCQDLIIVSAWYGNYQTDKRWQIEDKVGMDVTDQVKELVSDRELSMNKEAKLGFYNEVFKADPSPWSRKVIAVRYQYGSTPGSTVREIVAAESHALLITEDPEMCSHEAHEAKINNSFEIRTAPEGQNGGRKYLFRVESPEQYAHWIRILRQSIQDARGVYEREHALSLPQQVQSAAKAVHDSDLFQQFFGLVIMASFVISLVRTEMVPTEGSPDDKVFEEIDVIFTWIFTVELVVTFVAHAFMLFFQDAWRLFDTIIVLVSHISLSGADLPAVNSIRAVRVLRAVRLLKKSKSLRPIVDALFSSILPVLNSMVLLALITGTCSVAGERVTWLASRESSILLVIMWSSSSYLLTMIDPLAAIYASMAVGLFGPDEPILFGKLSRSLFTMFQVSRNFELTSRLRRHLSRGNAPGADLCKCLSSSPNPTALARSR